MMNAKIANEIFRYDAETGKLFWKVRPGKNMVVGTEIKTENERGYLKVGYKGKRYRVHRIVWLMIYGKFPDGHIDHIDHNPSNNRLENLRDVSASSNLRNQSISSRNTSGFSGVHYHKAAKKWVAAGVTLDGIRKHLGLFDTKEQAIEARKAFNRENGYHSNHGK